MDLRKPAVSRRHLAAGAAWSVPVVMAATAAPALAASLPTGTWGTICRIFYGTGTVNVQRMQVFLGVCHDGTGYKTGSSSSNYYLWTFTFDKAVDLPSLVTGSWFGMTATLSADGKTLTVKVWFTTVPTTNCYCGSLSINWEPGTQSMPVETTVTASMSFNGGPTNGTLVWKVPQRYDGTTSDNKPHYYISKSGGQDCYPETRYSYLAKSSSSWTACGVNGNDTSTVYPGGTCLRLSLTTGTQASLPAVC